MAKTSFSASGHLAQSADADPKGSGTAGETLAVGNVVYLKAADSKLWKYAASAEATCAGIVGVITTGGDADASVEFAQSGDSATGLSGLTAGTEYWAKSDGSLAAFSGVVAAFQ